MLTEKGIADIAFCPVRLKEEAGNPKRMKDDRSYQDDTIVQIQDALISGVANKKVVPSTLPNGRLVEPYDGSIWLVIPTEETDLLLTISSVKATKEAGQPWQITVTRKKDWKTDDEDSLTAERMIRRVLSRAFKEVFIKHVVVVETRYKNDPKEYISQNPTEQNLREADAYFGRMKEMTEGERPLIANVEKCSNCWWKECPYREEITGPSSGRPKRQVM